MANSTGGGSSWDYSTQGLWNRFKAGLASLFGGLSLPSFSLAGFGDWFNKMFAALAAKLGQVGALAVLILGGVLIAKLLFKRGRR